MNKSELFTLVLKQINETNINYAVVGRTEELPAVIPSDVDIIVSNNDLQNLKTLFWSLEKNGIFVTQILQHEVDAYYYVLGYHNQTSTIFIHPDICTDYYRNGKLFIKASDLLIDVTDATFEDGRSKGFKVLCSKKEFLYYLLKKIDKKQISDIQFKHIKNTFQKDQEGALIELKKYLNSESICLITEAILSDNISLFQNNILSFQSQLRGYLNSKFYINFDNLYLKLRRILKPSGLVIFINSKSNVCTESDILKIKENLLPMFRKTKEIRSSSFSLLTFYKSILTSTLVIFIYSDTNLINSIKSKFAKFISLIFSAVPVTLMNSRHTEVVLDSLKLEKEVICFMSERAKKRFKN